MSEYAELTTANISKSHQRILLVDDEPHILKALKRLLRNKDFEIFTATDATEALTILSDKDIQVMLTDHKMPNISGAELIELVRKDYPNIISIMLSGEADPKQVIRLLNEQLAMRFIQKPWCNDEIVKTIQLAFNQYQKANDGTWLNRLNCQISQADTQGFDSIINRFKASSDEFYVAAIQYANIGQLARAVGQKCCEEIQVALVNGIVTMLPKSAEYYYYEPGLLLITVERSYCDREIKAMLSCVLEKMVEQVSKRTLSIRLELKSAFQYVDDFSVSSELLVEHLKATMQSTSALRPLVQLNTDLQNKYSRQQQLKASIGPELDSGQFSIVVQPKVSLPSRMIESGEILLRWQHSTLGAISPLEFIRLAELDGQIKRVGDWVLDQGIQLISRLKRFSSEVKSISINVSARQLYQPCFVESLQKLLLKYKVDASSLELEITETCIAEDPTYIQSILWELKILGVSISVDDFGSGGTAYSFLTTLPIDVLKLDKCLIDDMAISDSKKKLVDSLIDICHSLDIEVVAEGAEDQATVALLESMKCDKIQGFVFSKALSAIEFEKMIVLQPFTNKIKRNCQS